MLGSADAPKGQTINHKNALNAVLFDAIGLVIQLDEYLLYFLYSFLYYMENVTLLSF
jgi:hypothetical protein